MDETLDPSVDAPATKYIPQIREELKLIPAANNHDGSPAWMIQDPICNKFYRIGWLDFEILLRWSMGNVDHIVDDVNSTTTLNIDESDVSELAGFLQQNDLLIASDAVAVNALIAKMYAKKKGVLNWLLHHYLFFRIPLVRPQKTLAKLLPFLQWLFTPAVALVVLMATFMGVFLAAREWDTFKNTFIDQLTFSGLFSYAVALVFSKFLHELGHAFTATRYGVRVAHMGIAMLVMLPMPYTDTSESWKLTNQRQRLNIASAGIITELALAGLATLAWGLAPEGSVKDALFFLATTSWVLTLIINLSPFLRFDGYFILSDIMDFPNLHQRSGALAKTLIRKKLLGFNDEWPESFTSRKKYGLIIFAILTWVYRLVLFLGIALLVYHFFFKVLGIFLFIVEILWFILLPIWNEVKVWLVRRSEIKTNRLVWGAAFLIATIAIGMIPWQTSIKGTGLIQAEQQLTIFTPIPGKLVYHHSGGAVQQGDVLFQVTSPDIAIQESRVQALSSARAQEIRGLAGVEDGESRRNELQSQQAGFDAEIKLYQDELSRMSLLAPFAGELRDVDDNVTVGVWVNPEQQLAVLVDTQRWVVDVLVEETDIANIKLGDEAKVYLLKSHLQQYSGKVTKIDKASRVKKLAHPMLAAQHGGLIPTLTDINEQLAPKAGLMKLQVSLDAEPNLRSIAIGNVVIQTEARAWIPSIFKYFSAILIRESGF